LSLLHAAALCALSAHVLDEHERIALDLARPRLVALLRNRDTRMLLLPSALRETLKPPWR
jgi:hypothetical protein